MTGKQLKDNVKESIVPMVQKWCMSTAVYVSIEEKVISAIRKLPCEYTNKFAYKDPKSKNEDWNKLEDEAELGSSVNGTYGMEKHKKKTEKSKFIFRL